MFRLGLLAAMTLPLLADDLDAADRLPPAAGLAGRSPTLAPHGMVCAAHPLAVQVGLDVLKAGGNAVDAAIAVNAALGLMEPMSCGPGGDLFAIVWDAKTQRLYGLNASGRAPYQATREYFAKRGLKAIPEYGPLIAIVRSENEPSTVCSMVAPSLIHSSPNPVFSPRRIMASSSAPIDS